MLANKWILLALNLAIVVVAYLGTVDWQDYIPSAAGTIVMVIAALKAILNVLLPAPGQKVEPTRNLVFTHKAG